MIDTKEYYKLYYIKNKIKLRNNMKQRHLINKDKLYEILGGKKCIRCGFNDERALQFDHINGDGHIQRLKYGAYEYAVFNYVRDPNIKLKLQVLCANCNWIKRHENNEHK